jgi:hypothetical protein
MDKKDETVRIIRPENQIRDKIGGQTDLRILLKEEVVAGAQIIVNKRKDEFLQLIRQDIARMENAWQKMEEKGAADEEIREIMLAHAAPVRDRAGTFDYPLASDICRSLVAFCEQTPAHAPHFRMVASKHLDSLRTVFRDNITGPGGVVGAHLIESLHLLVDKYLK